jgi:hypothetical protein
MADGLACVAMCGLKTFGLAKIIHCSKRTLQMLTETCCLKAAALYSIPRPQVRQNDSAIDKHSCPSVASRSTFVPAPHPLLPVPVTTVA